jgi:RND family efflux transporter MFP subunit
MDSPPKLTRQQKSRFGPGLISLGIAVAIVSLLTGLLHLRAANTNGAPEKTPLAVATVDYEVRSDYTRSSSYLGLVVAGQKANLGFEIPGTILGEPLRQGTIVNRGDVIATLDTSTLQSRHKATSADLQQARVELQLAQLQAERRKNLIATGAVSRDVYDETRLRAMALASRVDAVAARLEGIDIELGKSTLLAPYSGTLADRYLQQGSVVSPGAPVVRLLELAGQESHIGVSAERAGELQPGTRYALKLRDVSFQAELLSIRPDVNPITRTTTAVFAIPAHIDALDGEPVTLELLETVYESGGWLPISALLEGSRGVWTVLKLEHDGVEVRTVKEVVEVLDVHDDLAFVRGTLPSGSRVVANGVHRLSPGAAVSVLEGS